jgi:aminopeptidase
VDPATLEQLAGLAVGLGANVQPGQVVAVESEVGKEEVTRAVAAAAYRRGARFVDVSYFDPHVKRYRLELAAGETLDFVPPWYGARALGLSDARAAWITLCGPVSPGILDGVDPERAGRDQLPSVKERIQAIGERTVNWTALPCPTRGWAAQVYPELDPDAAYARLWAEVLHVLRLDEPEPESAWRERLGALSAVAERLTARRFDALHFDGPGTDFTVGLLPTSAWLSAGGFTTVDGLAHVPNLPTEEVFTAPDPARAEGVVRAVKPLELDGAIVRDFAVRFEGGRAVEFEGGSGVDALRARAALDEGACRLGEVALVDKESRIGRLGTVFAETLIDENAASHLALGAAYPFCVGEQDLERVNRSSIHVDFMVGSDEVSVTGITSAGERVPVLRAGAFVA